MGLKRGDCDDGGLVLAVEVEALPKAPGEIFSFGLAGSQGLNESAFGSAAGTCGLRQGTVHESSNEAVSNGCGLRADREDKQLAPVIRKGSRLALHLSAEAEDGTRACHFFVDRKPAATFAGIKGQSWVAGVTLCTGARVKITPPDGVEFWDPAPAEAAHARLSNAREAQKQAQATDEAA